VTLRDRILAATAEAPGLTDRELADRLLGPSSAPQGVNQAARALAAGGALSRFPRADGKIGNFLPGVQPQARSSASGTTGAARSSSGMSEDEVKRAVADWLEAAGWSVVVRWGRERGIDIEARRGGERWVIEAKGCGSLGAMRVNYFLSMLGETLQRMDDPGAHHSIALPDMPQFRGLWSRLPQLAKTRTGISAIFVGEGGAVVHLD